jgi:membrane associated rhomboid family serine protease
MFIPLHDDTPLKVIRFQFVTFSIITLNILIFLITGAFSSEAFQASIADGFGLVPYELVHVLQGQKHVGPIPEVLALFTSIFLHGGWLHLLGNMIFLWVFADNVEDAFGYVGFIFFYLLCGLAGGLTHVFMMQHSGQPLIGASGAVSGVLASYLVLFPRARVWILLFMRIPVPLPAFWVLGGWFLLQVLSLAGSGPGEEVAWWAHIGGFAAGLLLTLALRKWLFNAAGRIDSNT